MNSPIARPLAAACCAALISITGCTRYTLRPEAPASMPRADAGPLPLKVGLIVDEQAAVPGLGDPGEVIMSRNMLQRQGLSFGSRFAEALRGSRLFQEVRYPLPLSREAIESVDLTLSAQFGYRFTQDPAQAPKIFLVCFTGFITGALFTETSHHAAQGLLSVAGRSDKELKAYNESVDVVAECMVSPFAEMKAMKAGPPAALDNIVAKLVQDLIDDRALLARGKDAAPKAPEPSPQAPQPSAPPETPAPAPQAAAEPAPAPPPPPAAKPKPAVSYDDQLVP